MASKRIVRWSVVAALLAVAAVVIGVVSYVVVPDGARQRAIFVRGDLTQIAVRLEIYEKRHGSYPTTQQGLSVLVADDLLPEMPRDQWQHDYVYRFPSTRAGYSFDLFSLGPDGVESSDDLWLTR
jgi:general secretion pathway protein G